MMLAGWAGERRLAAMLLPKFASNFPERMEAVVSSLIKLSCQEPDDAEEAALVHSCCESAWRGLGRLCEVAAHAHQEKPLTKAIEHLVRCEELQTSSEAQCKSFLKW